jgi:hypothetical protein
MENFHDRELRQIHYFLLKSLFLAASKAATTPVPAEAAPA